jgi:hypothetical protein
MNLRSVLILFLLLIITGIAGWWLAQPVPPFEVPSVPRTIAPKVALHPPQLPAPKVDLPPHGKPIAAQGPTKPEGPLARFFADPNRAFKLTPEQLQTYLTTNKRNAESLLAALRLTSDIQFLQEAARHFPNDPTVQLELALRSGEPGERQRALEALSQADPDNALGDYLLGLEHLRQGDSAAAFEAIARGSGKGRMDSYSAPNMQSSEEAYLSAGFTPLEAKAAATFGLPVREAEPLQELAKSLVTLQQAYAANGDSASAETVRQMGHALGQQIQSEAPAIIHELIGMSIEKKFLDAANASARQQALKQRMDYIRSLTTNPRWQELMQQGSAADLSLYLDRQKLLGEEAAMRWWIAR